MSNKEKNTPTGSPGSPSSRRRIQFSNAPRTCSLRTSATHLPIPKSPKMDKRESFTKITRSPESPASKSMMLGARRRSRNNNYLSDLRTAKKQTNKDLKEFLNNIPFGTSPAFTAKLENIIESFIAKSLRQIYGVAHDTIVEINALKKEAITPADRAIVVEVLFVISSITRFEELIKFKNQGADGDMIRSHPTKEESPRGSNKAKTLPRKNLMESGGKRAVLPGNLPAIPPPTSELMGNSVYSIKKPSPGVRRLRKTSVGTPRNKTGAVIRQTLHCRICEQPVQGHMFTGHTELCAVKIQWEVRSLECDNYLRKLSSEFKKHLKYQSSHKIPNMKKVNSLKELDDITIAASELNNTELNSLDDLIKKTQKYLADDSDVNFLAALTQELHDWLSYKKIVWENIKSSQLLLRTLVGSADSDSTDKGLSAHIPSLKDFEIMKLLTKGGFARVYIARKRSDIFAIKVLNRQDINEKTQMENVFAERNIMATTSCPFVVRMFYAFATKDNLFLAMEFLNGGDLFSFLHNMETFDEETAMFYIAEMVLALEYLHSEGIVHRDLKPDNILVNKTGHVKLTDFGLSHIGLNKQTQGFLDSSKQHKDGNGTPKQIVGTPDYLAPEVLLALGHDFTVDWWALGVILYEFLVGIPPFYSETTSQIFQNILKGEIAWPEEMEFSSDAQDLILKLLVENPSERLGANGSEEVKSHPFFSSIEWDTLLSDGTPPFVPGELDPENMEMFFEDRQKFWPLVEEDFGDVFEESDLPKSSDQFDDFWCINVSNLKEKNYEIMFELLSTLRNK